jgi:hypothetical protein
MAGKTNILRPDFPAALRRYPLPVLAAALIAVWLIGDTFNRQFTLILPYEKWAIPALLFGFFSATAAGFGSVHARPWIVQAIQGLAFLAGIGLVFLVEIEGDTARPLLIALICAISLAAGLAARRGVTGYWLANARLAASLAACLTAAGIVTLGGAIVLHSVEALLDVRMRRIDDTLAIVLWTFVVPVSWLAFARFDEVDPADMQGNILFRILALATDALLIPLMLVFAAVIHVYAARIAILGELPKGQIGWIVPVYLVAGYGVFLLAQGPEAQFPRLRHPVRRFFLAGTAVPLILLGLGVAVRIEAYGITEDRHLLALMVLGGTLLLGSTAVRRPLDIRLVPMVAGTLALVAAVGPLSATSMTIRSQTARAYAILASVPPERWASAKDGRLSDRQKEDLVSAVRYLQRLDPAGLAALDPVWPPHLSKHVLELNKLTTTKTTFLASPRDGVVRLQKMTFIESFNLDWEEGSKTISNGPLEYILHARGNWLEVTGDGATARFDLSRLLEMEHSDAVPAGGTLVFESQDGRQGGLILDRIERKEGPEGRSLSGIRGKIILY